MSEHTFERACLARAISHMFDAREELVEIKDLDERYADLLDQLDDVRNALIDEREILDQLIAIPCRAITGRCSTSATSGPTCERLPIESLGLAEAAE